MLSPMWVKRVSCPKFTTKAVIAKIKKIKAYKLESVRAWEGSELNFTKTASILDRKMLKIGKISPFIAQQKSPKQNRSFLSEAYASTLPKMLPSYFSRSSYSYLFFFSYYDSSAFFSSFASPSALIAVSLRLRLSISCSSSISTLLNRWRSRKWPCSATLPSSTTTICWQFMIVLTLWAIVMVILSSAILFKVFWISF